MAIRSDEIVSIIKSAIDAFSFDKALIALNKACDARSISL